MNRKTLLYVDEKKIVTSDNVTVIRGKKREKGTLETGN